jgi:adenylate cyclase class 2
MQEEKEAFFLDVNKSDVRQKLRKINFELVHEEFLMQRKTFDFSHIAPGKNKWGRVRKEADKITMTIKEMKGEEMYELELEVDDFDKAASFFIECGIPQKSYQENTREKWSRDGIVATLDTWPSLQPFLEIEASDSETIKRISKELDLDLSKAMHGSIDIVYERVLGIPSEQFVQLSDVTFENPPK